MKIFKLIPFILLLFYFLYLRDKIYNSTYQLLILFFFLIISGFTFFYSKVYEEKKDNIKDKRINLLIMFFFILISLLLFFYF